MRSRRPDYEVDPETGCWNWLKTLTKFGYATGSFSRLGPFRTQHAHRAYWMVANSQPVPDGYDIHHKCKNPRCVNPDHLEALTAREHDVESFLTDRAGGLTLEDVRQIRELGRIQGYTAKKVAEMYGIHWRTVDDYWGSRRWALEFDDGPCRPICTCPVCGEQFLAEKRRNQVYCGSRCQAKINRERMAARRRALDYAA